MKNLRRALVLIVFAILIAAAWFFWRNPIGKDVQLYRISFQEQPGVMMQVQVPFVRDAEEYKWINVAIDFNQDGALKWYPVCPTCSAVHEEWVVRNMPPDILGGTRNRFTFPLPDLSVDQKKNLEAVVIISKEKMPEWNENIKQSKKRSVQIAAVQKNEVGSIFAPAENGTDETGLPRAFADHDSTHTGEQPETPPANGDAKTDATVELKLDLGSYYGKGNVWGGKYDDYSDYGTDYSGIGVAPTIKLEPDPEPEPEPVTPDPNARPPYFSAHHEDVPDTDQEYNECAPTALSNSFAWLAREYGFEDRMPDSTRELIDELKGDTTWENGVAPGESLAGKKEFIERRGLPLEAHQIGEDNDQDIMYKIYEELKKGQAVEVSLQYYKIDEEGNKVKDGAHLVTVTGASGSTYPSEGQFISLHDSGTSSSDGSDSRDVYQVKGNVVENYWSGGLTEIRYALAQSPVKDESGHLVFPESQLGMDANGLVEAGQSITKTVSRFGFFLMFVDHPGDHFVGDSFPVRGSVVFTNREQRVTWREESYTAKASKPWNLSGFFTANGVISPDRIENTPPQTSVGTDRYTFEQTFTCEREGLATVTYDATLSWDAGSQPIPEKIKKEYGDQLIPRQSLTASTPPFWCKARPGTQPEEESRMALPPKFSCAEAAENPEGKEIPMLKLDGKCFPKFQFRGGGNAHDNCGAEHYHGAVGDTVYSVGGEAKTDPHREACGFGKIGEVEEGKVKLTADQMAPFLAEAVITVDFNLR